jgi:hypothetical protein
MLIATEMFIKKSALLWSLNFNYDFQAQPYLHSSESSTLPHILLSQDTYFIIIRPFTPTTHVLYSLDDC